MFLVTKFYVLVTKFYVLGTKFCVLGTKFCILGSKFCILATKLEILIKCKYRHYLGMQIPSLPQNPNFVTASKSKLPQNLNFVTTSELKFSSIPISKNWKFNWNCKISFRKSKFNPKINKFRSKNKNFDPKMQNTKFRF